MKRKLTVLDLSQAETEGAAEMAGHLGAALISEPKDVRIAHQTTSIKVDIRSIELSLLKA